MTGRPRKGHRVIFRPEEGVAIPDDVDPITGLRFTIIAQSGCTRRSNNRPMSGTWRDRVATV